MKNNIKRALSILSLFGILVGVAPQALATDYATVVTTDENNRNIEDIVHQIPFSYLQSIPTTLSGYGITDAMTASAVTSALAAKMNMPSGTSLQYVRGDGVLETMPTAGKVFEGTTQRVGFPIIKAATVSSGTAVFHLTADGTSGGTALFPNGVIQDSVSLTVSDATASYQMSYAFSNSNKTITVTANKLTTSNILTGILGQAQANGASVKLVVWGY